MLEEGSTGTAATTATCAGTTTNPSPNRYADCGPIDDYRWTVRRVELHRHECHGCHN
jgi:hypothetical protein